MQPIEIAPSFCRSKRAAPGILVHILQEWDRYQVARTGHVLGKVPLQGVDVPCDVDNEDKIRLDLSERDPGDNGKRNQKIGEALSAALTDWQALVSLGDLPATR